jgi:hypothetical protein
MNYRCSIMKLRNFFGRYVVCSIICILFISNNTTASQDLIYQIEKFSPISNRIIGGHEKNAIYSIFIEDVYKFLPTTYTIQKKIINKINKSSHWKSIIKFARNSILTPIMITNRIDAKKFFGALKERVPYTYVVLGNMIKITEAPIIPTKERFKNAFSKHYLISSLAHSVHYAGEIHIVKNSFKDEIFVIFDNASGTYKPADELLSSLKELLRKNFNTLNDGLYFMTRSFEQKKEVTTQP